MHELSVGQNSALVITHPDPAVADVTVVAELLFAVYSAGGAGQL